MKYRLTNYIANPCSDTASAEDARRVRAIFKCADPNARVHKRGDVYVLETGMSAKEIYDVLPYGLGVYKFRLKHIVGIFTHEDAEKLMQTARKEGGCVNYASEAFDNVYLDIVTSKGWGFTARLWALSLEKSEWVDM